MDYNTIPSILSDWGWVEISLAGGFPCTLQSLSA